MTEKYKQYLDRISPYIQEYFAQQAPYIFCKEGCSICCEVGLYPFSEIEFKYAMEGFNALKDEQKSKIQKKVKEIKKLKIEPKLKPFMYECPFLLEKKCSIYNHRGIICRSYGLIQFVEDKNGNLFYQIPCCVDSGLNYSQVYDHKKSTISKEMHKNTGIEEEPLSYNVGLKYLLNNEFTEDIGIEFGEQKALIDWFDE